MRQLSMVLARSLMASATHPALMGRFVLIVLEGFAVRCGLYGLCASSVDLLARRWRRAPRVQAAQAGTVQRRREMAWSACTLVLNSCFAVLLLVGPWARLYFRIAEHGCGYLCGSVVFLLVVQDTYFYWIHRLLHRPRWYRHVHAVHHRSKNPTVWAALAFHPVEALLQGALVPIVLWCVPLHPLALATWFGLMLLLNAEGHCGYVLRPAAWVGRWPWRWYTGSTYHNLHHQRGRLNFGLYFTLWDRIMGSRDPDYDVIMARLQQN